MVLSVWWLCAFWLPLLWVLFYDHGRTDRNMCLPFFISISLQTFKVWLHFAAFSFSLSGIATGVQRRRLRFMGTQPEIRGKKTYKMVPFLLLFLFCFYGFFQRRFHRTASKLAKPPNHGFQVHGTVGKNFGFYPKFSLKLFVQKFWDRGKSLRKIGHQVMAINATRGCAAIFDEPDNVIHDMLHLF